MDVVGLLNNINDKSDMFAVKTWTSEWSNSFQENQVRIDFIQSMFTVFAFYLRIYAIIFYVMSIFEFKSSIFNWYEELTMKY